MLRYALLLLAPLAVVVPLAIAGTLLLHPAEPAQGCPARLAALPGPLHLRIVTERADHLDATALQAYLADRLGREVRIDSVTQTDAAGFQRVAGAQPESAAIFLFFSETAHFRAPQGGAFVDADGYAWPGGACAWVAEAPGWPVSCNLASGARVDVQPSFAAAAHEIAHLLGVQHSTGGLMGSGAHQVCGQDVLDAAQLSLVQDWGSD